MASLSVDTVFLVAMEYEMNNIFESVKTRLMRVETTAPYATYSISGTHHVIVLTGIGKSNAAAATQYAITKFSPECLVNIGLIGCLDSKTYKVGDVCLVKTVSFADVDVTVFRYKFGQIPDAPDNIYTLCTETTLFKSTQNYIDLITIDSFVTDKAQVQKAVEEFKPSGLDMELASIAHIAQRNGYLEKLISIKAIVDFVNEKSKQDFYEKEALAFRNLKELVSQLFA